jgi:hypothetical protein
MRSYRCLGWVTLGAALVGSPAGGQEVFPDLDLKVECPPSVDGPAGGKVRFPGRVVLRSESAGADLSLAVRAWSLSLKAGGAAAIVEATTSGTGLPETIHAEGYDKTELTQGEGNEGAVSAVVLSFHRNISLPLSGDSVLLNLVLEATIPDSGCLEARVDFEDGLVGSGQPVKNILTCGEGFTRRDDGGESDNDRDGHEPGSTRVCLQLPFLRGDVNGDKNVNLSDGLSLLGFLFQSGLEPSCMQAADTNSDGAFNISDPVFLLNHLFRGGPGPATPYPECGFPPGPSPFACAGDTGC